MIGSVYSMNKKTIKQKKGNQTNWKLIITTIFSFIIIISGLFLLIYNIRKNSNNKVETSEEYVKYDLKEITDITDNFNFLSAIETDNFYESRDVIIKINQNYIEIKIKENNYKKIYKETGKIKDFLVSPTQDNIVALNEKGDLYIFREDLYYTSKEEIKETKFKKINIDNNTKFKDIILLNYNVIGLGEDNKYYKIIEDSGSFIKYDKLKEIVLADNVISQVGRYYYYPEFLIDINGKITLAKEGKKYNNKILLPNGQEPIVQKAFIEDYNMGQGIFDLYIITIDNKLYRVTLPRFDTISISTEFNLEEVNNGVKVKSISYPKFIVNQHYKSDLRVYNLEIEFVDGKIMIFDQLPDYGFNMIEGAFNDKK